MVAASFGVGVAVGVTAAAGWAAVLVVIGGARRRREIEEGPEPNPDAPWVGGAHIVPAGQGVPGYHDHDGTGHVHNRPAQGPGDVPHGHPTFPEIERAHRA